MIHSIHSSPSTVAWPENLIKRKSYTVLCGNRTLLQQQNLAFLASDTACKCLSILHFAAIEGLTAPPF